MKRFTVLATLLSLAFGLPIVLSEDDYVYVDAQADYQPPPKVYKDMGDKYKHMSDRPNYKKKTKKKTKTSKPPSPEATATEAWIGADGEALNMESLSPQEQGEAAMRKLEVAEKEFKKQEKEHIRAQKEMEKQAQVEMKRVENERRRQSAEAPREFKRRLDRIRSQVKRANFNAIELTAVEAEIEALKTDGPKPPGYSESPMGRGDMGILPPVPLESPYSSAHSRDEEVAEREARKERERDRFSRLWALERSVLERSRGYKATAGHDDL